MADDYLIPGTEREFTSFHFMLDVEWLTKALEHAKCQKNKCCSLVLSIKHGERLQYKVVDGIGGLATLTGCGDWEPIIRREFAAEREGDK